MFKIVEKKNENAVHGIFDSEERAQRHMNEVIPEYIRRGYFTDKTLKAGDFKIICGK